jgi:hypothetical protein
MKPTIDRVPLARAARVRTSRIARIKTNRIKQTGSNQIRLGRPGAVVRGDAAPPLIARSGPPDRLQPAETRSLNRVTDIEGLTLVGL